MSIVFGDKTVAWLDVWSLEHIVAGMSAYGLCQFVAHRHVIGQTVSLHAQRNITFILLLLLAYVWETLEHYLESGVTGIDAVTYWFQGVEFWGNRLITDPLMMVIGGVITHQMACVLWPARLFSTIWLFVHIVIFPHSMYLHDLLPVMMS